MRPLVPDDEMQRVAALGEAQVLDTEPEPDFDDIAVLAAEVCGTPISLVTLIDADRQWFKAKVGFDLDETGRDISFCTYTVQDRQMLEVDDAATDPRFAGNPLVTERGVRFYAGAPLQLQDGHVVGTVCVLDHQPRQLTGQQQRALRSLARHATAHLELRRYAHTAAEAARRLRELDRMKDSFLANVSHELRTPLSSIRGYLELLLDDDHDATTARRFLSVMQRNADRLLRLIDDLLLVAGLHDDGLNLDRGEIDLADLAYQLVHASRPLAEHRNITLIEHTDQPVRALGDPRRLSQALSHLLFNALKFTPNGGRVTVAVTDDGPPTVAITDTGTGIAAADLPHLFDRFHRAHTTDAQAVQGIGVGLTIVKAIIDAHQGTITVDSRPEGGTTVRVTLPRPETDVTPQSSP